MSYYDDDPERFRNDDTVLSWVVAITVLIAIMAIVIGHKGYVAAANGDPRFLASTTGAASPIH